jgi:hypothetical protein
MNYFIVRIAEGRCPGHAAATRGRRPVVSIFSTSRARTAQWQDWAKTGALRSGLAAIAGAAALALMGPLTPAGAQMLCTEPLAPSCLREGSNFDSEAIRKRCITDIQDYIVKIDEFVECNRKKNEELLKAKEDAAERLKAMEAETR